MTVLNLNKNDGNPLFLGSQLGLQEYTDPVYPQLEELALLQRSQFWTETEIDMSKDAIQWKGLDEDIQDISILNLSWQIMADSIVGRSPFTVLLPFITNPEYEGMMVQWGYFENLHSRAYSNIVRNTFPEPQEIINEVKRNEKAFGRLELIVDLFNGLAAIDPVYNDREELKCSLYKTIIAIYALESMQFYCSFACTFALAEQDILNGFADNLKLIAKDEALHTRMSLEVLNILKADPEWQKTIEAEQENAMFILTHVMEKEREWSKYLFSEGRQVMGLNAHLLDEYLCYVSANSFKAIGFEINFEYPERNPIPWIDKYLDPSKVQVAPQERQITNYRIGSTDGDLGDLGDLDW